MAAYGAVSGIGPFAPTFDSRGIEMTEHRDIYATSEDGGVQLAASADRWYLYDDYVHLSPHHPEGELLKFEAELKPFVDNPNRGALAIIDMQNDFCSPGGWTDASGLDYRKCREAIPACSGRSRQRVITACG